MAKTFEWVITQMTSVKQEGNLQDVVILVNFFRNLKEVDDDGKLWISQSLGDYKCPNPSEDNYTPYKDLTENQVIEWLEAGLDVASIDRYLEANILEQKNPPVIVLPNPWDVLTEETI